MGEKDSPGFLLQVPTHKGKSQAFIPFPLDPYKIGGSFNTIFNDENSGKKFLLGTSNKFRLVFFNECHRPSQKGLRKARVLEEKFLVFYTQASNRFDLV